MKEHDNLQEIFDSVEITPNAAAKQRAKERMLACAREIASEKENENFIKNNEETKSKIKIAPRFALNRYHFQGAAAAALIVCAVSFAMPMLNATPELLQGSLFKQIEEMREISITLNPSEIEAGQENITFEVYGLPKNELEQIKPEHIFLAGYLSNFAVQSLEVDKDTLIITVSLRETESGEFPTSYNNGVIMIMPETLSNNEFYYYGEVLVKY
ncbi:MAG: hypothetical protein FWH05_00175 [Oscillospiraceae bacterium]|nr:hypothetical protein [Oscillospiraceae bacterium]